MRTSKVEVTYVIRRTEVFAPKVAKPRMRAAGGSTSRLPPWPSALVGHRLGHDPIEQAAFLQRTIGNQAILRILAQQTSHPTLTSPRFSGDPLLEACFDDRARMTQGHRGRSVEKVQQALLDLGYNLGPSGADGIYGQKTWDAVKQFKANEGLGFEDMGDVGPGTMHRLDELFGSKSSFG